MNTHLNYSARIKYAAIVVLTVALCAGLGLQPVYAANIPAQSQDEFPPQPQEQPQQLGYTLFLPGMFRTTTSSSAPLLLGIYPENWWAGGGPTDVIEREFRTMDSWMGKSLSLAGVFHSFDPSNLDATVILLLTTIWDNGYTPFVNIYASKSAATIASGGMDQQIRDWARAYAVYANGGERIAFLAPLQEMNGYWVPYGLNPVGYKQAYLRIQTIFREEGVPDESVRWVFAPNGYSDPKNPPFEDYYPGDDVVDVVALSAYNFGYNPLASYKKWQTPEKIYSEYIARAHTMTPKKWILVGQTGTTAYTSSGYDVAAKNEWLEHSLNYLAEQPGFHGIIFYNGDVGGFDWQIYEAGGEQFTGFAAGAQQPAYGSLTPQELKAMPLNIR